ncbi:uncharacterized protein [Cherax quadricarinatus]|uniref:uncharacterized protein n=1 Tax=Cherax quadricarinatus TaxID=27406 RepID=UPI00387E2831
MHILSEVPQSLSTVILHCLALLLLHIHCLALPLLLLHYSLPGTATATAPLLTACHCHCSITHCLALPLPLLYYSLPATATAPLLTSWHCHCHCSITHCLPLPLLHYSLPGTATATAPLLTACHCHCSITHCLALPLPLLHYSLPATATAPLLTACHCHCSTTYMQPGMASNIPIVLTIILVLAVKKQTAVKNCAVSCSSAGSLAADPFDCQNYYVCLSSTSYSDFPNSCPDGENFDSVHQVCTTSAVTCPSFCLKCTYDCTKKIVNKASDQYNCSVYYECSGTTPLKMECPSGLYFDGHICQTDMKKCCSCRPDCTGAPIGQKYPDYRNCTNYYLCTASGIPDEAYHFHCPTGNFDVVQQICVEGAKCETQCDEVPYCDDSYICASVGYFPRCYGMCDTYYYLCDINMIGQPGELLVCSDGKVIDPDIVKCVDPEDCPY